MPCGVGFVWARAVICLPKGLLFEWPIYREAADLGDSKPYLRMLVAWKKVCINWHIRPPHVARARQMPSLGRYYMLVLWDIPS
jgi:hypothetical protein